MKKIVIVFLASIFLFSCTKKETAPKNKNEKKAVTYGVVEKREYTPEIEVTGTIEPFREANLSAILPGRVEKFYYDEGERVAKGGLIARLASEKLTQAKMEYQVVKKDYQRIKRLYQEGSVTEQKYDHIKGKYKAKKANYELVKSNTEIRAPFDGTLVEKMINEKESFMLVNPGLESGYSHANGIVRFMQLDKLKLTVNVNEKYLPNLQKGQSAVVTTDVYPEQEFTATITKISPIVNKSTRTGEVVLKLDQARKLKPGMYGYVRISLEPRKDIFVDQNAIITTTGPKQDYLYVLRNNKAYQRRIKQLYRTENQVAVEGVETGEKVILEGKMNLNDGSTVQVVNKKRN